MSWIAPIASLLEILLLLYVATMDVATRTIRNEICLALALLGIAGQLASPVQVAQSLTAAAILLLLLLVIYTRGWIGGGDVKLLVALAIGLPLLGVIQLLTITALAGGVLALVHLMMRQHSSGNSLWSCGQRSIRRIRRTRIRRRWWFMQPIAALPRNTRSRKISLQGARALRGAAMRRQKMLRQAERLRPHRHGW
jgi:Flp pilus assembly protein protease CpaA